MRKTKVHVNTLKVGYLYVFYVIIISIIYAKYVHTDYAYSVTDLDYRLWADSLFYKLIAQSDTQELVSVSKNYFGPVFIYRLFEINEWRIYVFNLLLLASSLFILVKFWIKQSFVAALLILFNPMTILSLFFVNKEIIGMAAVIFFAAYMTSSRLTLLISALALSTLVRWQLTSVFLIMLPVLSIIKNGNKRWYVSAILACFFLGMNIAYPIFLKNQVGDFEQDAVMRSNVARLALNLQNNYLFFLAFPIKTALNLFGNPLEVWDFISKYKYHRNIYDSATMVTQIINLIVAAFAMLLAKRPSNRMLSFIVIYLIIFTANPFIQARYFYPIFPLLYITVADSKWSILRKKDELVMRKI